MLFRFVRHWARRAMVSGPSVADRGRDVWVMEAVDALSDRGDVTVNDVAAEMGIDQSGASRMLAHAAQEGLIAIVPDADDRRRRAVVVTEQGRHLLAAAHDWQEQVFLNLTADWSSQEREEFTRSMARLVAASTGEE